MRDENIGKRLARLRKKKGKSQAEMAADLFTTRNTIAKWETGAQDLKSDSVIKLSKYFGVSCDELLTGNKPEHVCQTDKLGLSSKAIATLIQLKQLNDCQLVNDITIGDIAKNLGLLEQIRSQVLNKNINTASLPSDIEAVKALHLLNDLFDADLFNHLFIVLHDFFCLQDGDCQFIPIEQGRKKILVDIKSSALVRINNELNGISDILRYDLQYTN